MAKLSLIVSGVELGYVNIDDNKINDLAASFCGYYGYDGPATATAKALFFLEKIKDKIRKVHREYTTRTGISAARISSSNEADTYTSDLIVVEA